MTLRLFLLTAALLAVCLSPARADAPASPTPLAPKQRIELMKEAESPISTIAASVQWNAYMDFNAKTPGALLMVGVLPQKVDRDWFVIHRVTLQLPYVPLSLVSGRGAAQLPGPEVGLGDLSYTPYLSPVLAGKWLVAAGPAVTLPTATGRILGTGKLLAGPSFVVMYDGKQAIGGVVVTQQWSIAGTANRAEVSAATIQPFFYYNFPSRWYLLSTPRLYSNWNATGPKWSLPVGGGFGRFFRIGNQPVNMSIQAFYHLERPAGALWSMNLQFQLLFPTIHRPDGAPTPVPSP